ALTNVHVTSLAEAASTASHEINSMRLRELYDLLLWCKEEYWKIPKAKRIECGLRTDVGGGVGYSGDWAIKAGEDLISKGLRGNYPITTDEVHAMISQSIIEHKLPGAIGNIQDLLVSVEPLVSNLE